MIRNIVFGLFLLACQVQAMNVSIAPVHGDVCGTGNGRLEAIVSGGVGPYSFQWSNGTTEALNTDLIAGIYSVTVTDGLGDEATAQAYVDQWSIADVAGAFIMSFPGAADPYCSGALNGPFFRMRVYDDDRWRWGMPMGVPSAPAFLFNGQPVTPVHTGAYGGPQWFEMGAFLEYYVPIPASCGTNAVQMTIASGAGCSGTISVAPGCPLVWPEITVVETTGSCSNLGSGSLRIQKSGSAHATTNLTVDRLGSTNVYTGYPDPGELYLTGLLPGTYRITMDIGGASLFWAQTCGVFTIDVEVPNNGLQCGMVQGTAFVDNNRNCTRQGNEPAVPNSILMIEPGPLYTYTNGLGGYNLPLPPGSYTIVQQSSVVNEHCSGAPQAFTIAGGNTVTRNFPDTAIVPLDLRMALTAGAARPGFELHYTMNITNLTPAVSGALSITLAVDEALSLVSAVPAPTSVVGNVLTWEQAQLVGFQSRNIQMHFLVPPDLGLLGHVLEATASVQTVNIDGNLANNTVVNLRTITGSYDPNDKLATTSTGGTFQWLIDQDEWIDYTIRFQNTGTDTAFNVIITDTLPATLDPATLEVGAASHPFTWELRDAGTLKFRFLHILLPDSNVNEPLSHGFVGFRIRPRLPIAPGTVIENIANIYFDHNPPVITEPSVLNAVVPIRVDLRAFLGGAYDAQSGLMQDQLRSQGLLPAGEPYTAHGYAHSGAGGGETISPALLAISGSEAIVDWVIVELRDATTPATVLHSRAGLVRRDGRVTDKDGQAPLSFTASDGSYFVAIRHRNHLGAMTATPIALSATPVTIDLTTASTPAWGTGARMEAGNAMVLWPGDVNFDQQVKYTGTGNDRDPVLVSIGGSIPTATASGYHGSDTNMDGEVKYTGAGNDRDIILQSIGGTVPTAVRNEQLP